MKLQNKILMRAFLYFLSNIDNAEFTVVVP